MPANAFDGVIPLIAEQRIVPDIPAHDGHGDQPPLVPTTATLHESPWQRTCTDEVVISGLSCRLPESDNVDEFCENLMNNIDMVTEDDRRWPRGSFGLPTRSGKLKDLTKFDAMFFNIHSKQAAKMDPQVRMLLEVTYEAIVDAGINPESLRGSNTGVFVGASASESADSWSANAASTDGFTMIGCQRGMFSNRLSYFFDFKGPSFTVDTACSSSLLAMDNALLAIRTGQCDTAIVAGASICIKPATAIQFNKLTMLSPDGACKSFEETGNGYVRSEGIVAILLQKYKDSKRVYAQVIHSKTNSDGAKEDGKSITFPSGQCQKTLMSQVYEECGLHPSNVVYVEAHGTGTKAGDPEEVNSITDIFCKGRQSPLLIGSTKSNMGHPEPASGLSALTKVLISSERQMIPANLHFNKPNPNIPGLLDNRLRVVSSNTPWDGGLVAINSFGFGGTNVHSLINTRVACDKISRATSSTKQTRLLTYCGRTEQTLQSMFTKISRDHSNDADLHALLSQSSSQSYLCQPFRGYTILGHRGEPLVDIQKCTSNKRQLWYVFTGMGCQWFGMAKELMQLEIFAQSIMRANRYLLELNIDLYKLITSDDASSFNNTINSFVSIAAIQVALVDVLSAMGLTPDGIVGHSVGELGCGYADGSLTSKEAILAAYWRGRCIVDAKLESGAMAAVGLTWKEAKARCPPGVVPACHNAEDTVTISGPADAVHEFVVQLKQEGYFAKEVSSNGVAFHSHYMSAIAPKLKECLAKVIKPKRRGARWVSTSIPEREWGTDLHSFSSADYHVNNLVSPVLFQEALAHIPEHAVTVEIAPHALLQSILKRSLSPECLNIGLQKRGHVDNIGMFYQAIGKLYQAGFNPNMTSLYKAVSYPVPRGTPSISSLIEWDHSVVHAVPTAEDFDLQAGGAGRVEYEISLNDSTDNENSHLSGHKIDGRILYPATGYLVLAWKTLALSLGKEYGKLPVVFDDVNIHEATILKKEGSVTIYVSLLPSTGAFEVIEDGKVKASGRVSTDDESESVLLACPPTVISEGTELIELNAEDVYKDLRLRGYEYGGQFKGIVKAQSRGETGSLRWEEDWITFLDTMLQVTILGSTDRSLRLPTRIGNVRIDPREHMTSVVTEGDNSCVKVTSEPELSLIHTAGVQIFGLQTTAAPRRKNQKAPVLETYEFVADEKVIAAKPDFQDYLDCCSFAAYSTLKCLDDNAKALRIPRALATQLSQMYKQNRNLDSLLDAFPKDRKFALLDYLKRLSEGCNDPADKLYSLHEDALLSAIYAPNYLKPAIDLVLENCGTTKLRLTELVDPRSPCWYPKVLDYYDNSPTIRTEYTLWTTEHDETEHDDVRINVSQCEHDVNRLRSTEQHLLLFSHLKEVKNSVEIAKKSLKANGFLLTVEYNVEWESVQDTLSADFELIYSVQEPIHTLSLWKLKSAVTANEETITVSGFGTDWVTPLKAKLSSLSSSAHDKRLWVVSEDANGAVGLVNCLRLEESGDKIRCIFNAGSSKLPDLDSSEIKQLKQKDLVMNVYSNGSWGSYRHIPFGVTDKITTQYANVNISSAGAGLSNLRWIESPTKHITNSTEGSSKLCTVSHAALNFRDVMLATGKLAPEAIPGYEKMQDCLLGMEFSGYCDAGERRVMGLCSARALATVVRADERFLWDVPSDWSMSDAATVPVVYSTAYYALIVRGRLRRGETVLIHSGSGGVGQAAIGIALSLGCNVITTVGTEEKKQHLLTRFPGLKSQNILHSRSSLFEMDTMRLTRGRGVNVVLNSLAKEKLQASVRVLSQHGRFLEIGKFDLANNSALGMSVFLKNTSFHGILLDSLFDGENTEWEEVRDLVCAGIKSGVVRPLNYTSYEKYQIEEAFRFMSSGKHIGKVLIQVNPSTNGQLGVTEALPRYFCHPDKSYLIVGGLGGFGLQLAQWLATRGAKKLVLTSRSGVTNGYQAKVLDQLARNGTDVRVSTRNAACYSEAKQLLQECMSMGPLGGLFNLAMVLKDAMMENQTESLFRAVFEPKATCTLNLDSLTRELCSHSLQNFTVFSSISGGRGNAGQANYGFANTAMERICEKRQSDGFPGLAIQWGAIGDVGVVISSLGDNETEVGGTLPQRISSCLTVLDTFLCRPNASVLSSYVVADKKSAANASEVKDVVSVVLNILGVHDVSSVSDDSTLGSLGIDSLMGVEVKQVLERDFDLNFSMKEIRALTITSLRAANLAKSTNDPASSTPESKTLPEIAKSPLPKTLCPSDSIVKMKACDSSELTLFMVHPIEGHVEHLQQLASHVNATVYGLQCSREVPVSTIEELAAHYVNLIKKTASSGRSPYNIVGYSFGATVAFEMCLQLETAGESFSLILLDGSHSYVKMFTSIYSGESTSQESKEVEALRSFLERTLQISNYQQITDSLKNASSLEERLSIVSSFTSENADYNRFDKGDIEAAALSYYQKLVAADVYTPASKLHSPVLLLKAEQSATVTTTDSDYNLSTVCDSVSVESCSGNHVDFVIGENSAKVAAVISQWLQSH